MARLKGICLIADKGSVEFILDWVPCFPREAGKVRSDQSRLP